MNNDDITLIQLALAGDETASGQLFRRYAKGLYRYMYFRTGQNHQDAEDLTQEVFINAWKNLKVFDTRRQFWPWLCGISARRLSKYYRDNNKRKSTLNADLAVGALVEALESRDPLPEQILDNEETRQVIDLALTGLTPTYQKLLQLKYLKGHTLAQISEQLSLSVAAVNSGLQRARTALRLALESYQEDLSRG